MGDFAKKRKKNAMAKQRRPEKRGVLEEGAGCLAWGLLGKNS